MKVRWSSEPSPHQHPAAISFPILITNPTQARFIADALADQPWLSVAQDENATNGYSSDPMAVCFAAVLSGDASSPTR